VPDMLKAGMILKPRLLHAHHRGVVWLRCASLVILSTALLIVVVVATIFVRKVCRALVLVRAAIVLEPPNYFIDV
jgi:hypothetical protein